MATRVRNKPRNVVSEELRRKILQEVSVSGSTEELVTTLLDEYLKMQIDLEKAKTELHLSKAKYHDLWATMLQYEYDKGGKGE